MIFAVASKAIVSKVFAETPNVWAGTNGPTIARYDLNDTHLGDFAANLASNFVIHDLEVIPEPSALTLATFSLLGLA